MADIKQAAKWMKEGKRVKRPEMGWACGDGKATIVYCPAIREPDLMVKMADLITDNFTDVANWLTNLARPTP